MSSAPLKVFRHTVQIFCAFCRSPRRVSASRRVGPQHILGASLAAALTMTAIWREFDPRVMVIFVVFLAFTEVLVQVRWRMSLACRHCGFDPVVYKKNPEVAADKVKQHLQLRRESPNFLLAKPLNLPRRKADPPPVKPGRLVSKKV